MTPIEFMCDTEEAIARVKKAIENDPRPSLVAMLRSLEKRKRELEVELGAARRNRLSDESLNALIEKVRRA